MVLSMSRPFQHPKTGIYWFRKRLPADIALLLGKKEERYSLRTRDPNEAKRRHAEEMLKLEARWDQLRSRPGDSIAPPTVTSMTEAQAHQRAAWMYRFWIERHRDNPSEQRFWRTDLYEALWPRTGGLSGWMFSPTDPTADIPPPTSASDEYQLSKLRDWCFEEADDLLDVHDLTIDEESRARLAKAIGAAVQRASLMLERLAQGEQESGGATSANGVSPAKSAATGLVKITALFEGWNAERKPAAKTVYEWGRVVGEFTKFLGHDDARRVSAEDVVAWKAALVEQGRRPKTIRDAKIAPIRAVMQWAVDNRRLSANPAARVTMEIRKRAGEGQRSFNDQEAEVVLGAALAEKDPVRKWVPWLCAYTGARVSEVCQLRRQDLVEVDGVWAVRIDPDAGPLKNRGSERTIPLHSALIAEGFLRYVATVPDGPLFPGLPPDKFGKRGGNGTKVLGRWVRSLGLTDTRLSPNHSWRHRFKTSARRHGLAPDIVDAMTGHATRSVGDSYGEYPIDALKRELEKIPALAIEQPLAAKELPAAPATAEHSPR